ncbi:MAG: hypothetical protein OEQ74_07620, partial [Gammaproteobacteria bacterium]|nr:hypothetical protein [Gammaproteobacteria bacterium]
MRVRMTIFTVLACLATTSAFAVPQFLGDWLTRYGAVSTSGNDSSCQLCHGDPSGGSPWNSYGWDMVLALEQAACDSDDSGSVSSDEALVCIELFNSDEDTSETDN